MTYGMIRLESNPVNRQSPRRRSEPLAPARRACAGTDIMGTAGVAELIERSCALSRPEWCPILRAAKGGERRNRTDQVVHAPVTPRLSSPSPILFVRKKDGGPGFARRAYDGCQGFQSLGSGLMLLTLPARRAHDPANEGVEMRLHALGVRRSVRPPGGLSKGTKQATRDWPSLATTERPPGEEGCTQVTS